MLICYQLKAFGNTYTQRGNINNFMEERKMMNVDKIMAEYRSEVKRLNKKYESTVDPPLLRELTTWLNLKLNEENGK